MPRRLMTDREAAEYTGLSKWALNEGRRKNLFPPGVVVSINGIRRFYFNADALDKFLDGQQGQQPQPLRLMK